MPENQGEKKRERELMAAKAKKELADTLRVAKEMQVENQNEITRIARDWAGRLFDTGSMSGAEFDDWKGMGLTMFGDAAGTAAEDARKNELKPSQGYAVSTEDGRIIARDRIGGGFFFIANPTFQRAGAGRQTRLDKASVELDRDPGDPWGRQ